MSWINSIIGYPLGWIMWLFYTVIPNYGIALILFTVVTKLALLPLSVKQQKSTAKMAAFRPQIDALNSKYKNNKEKLQEETMKLYQEEGYNPLSGCLPLLIQMPILFGLIDVIYKPLTHILRLPSDVIAKGVEIVNSMGTMSYSPEIEIYKGIVAGVPEFAALGESYMAQIRNFDLTFLGMDLSLVPVIGFNLLMLIPILSGATSFMLSMITTKQTAATQGQAAAGNGMTKTMMYIMPIFSVVFAFQVPAGVGFYWLISNIIAVVQAVLLNKFYNPAEMAEKARIEMESKRKEQREEKIEAKKKLKAGDEDVVVEKALSGKEAIRIKLAAARKRDAEKYGEEYIEVTDEDLR